MGDLQAEQLLSSWRQLVSLNNGRDIVITALPANRRHHGSDTMTSIHLLFTAPTDAANLTVNAAVRGYKDGARLVNLPTHHGIDLDSLGHVVGLQQDDKVTEPYRECQTIAAWRDSLV